jgi:hypothetical protein
MHLAQARFSPIGDRARARRPLDRSGNTFEYAAEINADPATVQEHAHELHEQALTNDAAKDADIAKLRHEPWLSYDVWLVNSDAGK